MKSLFTVLLWLYFPILLFSQYKSSTEDKTLSSWRYGFSISAFNTELDQPGNLGKIHSSQGSSYNYQINIYKEISRHFFLETGAGIDAIKRNQKIHGGFTYTEDNSVSINNSTIENKYSASLHNEPIAYNVNFILRTTKYDEAQDYQEGEYVPIKFQVLNRVNNVKIPLSINYKFSDKKFSIYTGLGIAANFLLNEKLDLTSFRAYGLTVSDRPYISEDQFSPSRFNKRNVLQSYEIANRNTPNKFFLDGLIKFGIIHEHWRNTFMFNINYHRSITNFYSKAKLEQMGIQVGWRYGLYL